jgi:6-phosphogluconolactonase
MAHPHQLIFDPAEKYAFGCDLGNDKVYQFSFDQGKLVPHPTTPTIDQKPGSGPRHIAFHPNLKNAYLVHELDNTLTIFDYESGSLTEKRVISTLPRGSDPKSTYPAEVYVTKVCTTLCAYHIGWKVSVHV